MKLWITLSAKRWQSFFKKKGGGTYNSEQLTTKDIFSKGTLLDMTKGTNLYMHQDQFH